MITAIAIATLLAGCPIIQTPARGVASGGGGGGTTYNSFTSFDSVPGGVAKRSNYSGRLGHRFTPSANITVTQLGRWSVPGNTGSVTVRLQDSSGTDLATASVDVSAGSNAMAYATLGSPVSLTSGTTYNIVAQEVSGGNEWWDSGIVVTFNTTHLGSFTSVFASGTSGVLGDVTANTTYGPVGFKYTQP